MAKASYDGASNMSSSRSGVQARIQQVAPLATYVCALQRSLSQFSDQPFLQLT